MLTGKAEYNWATKIRLSKIKQLGAAHLYKVFFRLKCKKCNLILNLVLWISPKFFFDQIRYPNFSRMIVLVLMFFFCATTSLAENEYNEQYFRTKCSVSHRSSTKGCDIAKITFPTCVPWSTDNCEYRTTKPTKNRRVILCPIIDCTVRCISLGIV